MNDMPRARSDSLNGGNSNVVSHDLVEMIWQRKGCVIASLFLTLAVGAGYLITATPIYEIQARLLVQKQGVNLESTRRTDFEDPNFLATQAQILRSPVIVRQALQATTYPTEPGDDPVPHIIDSLSVDAVRGTNVLTLAFRTPHAQAGTKLIETIIATYTHFNQEETLRLLGKLGDTARIQESLWQAQVRAKELGQTAGYKHPELRGVEEQIALLETLLRDREEADRALAESQARERVQVLKAPAYSQYPIWPRPSLLFAVCGVVGLAGGLGLTCLLVRIDPRLRSAEDVRGHLALPVVGSVSEVRAPWTARKRDTFQARVVREWPGSSVAEAFRALRTHLEHSGGSARPKVVQIVSPRQGDGKTTVAANLALSFAQLGRRVVVVDADLRCAALHRMLEVPGSKGLTSVLRDGMPLDEAIQRSPLGEVDVLAAGPEVANPVELLAQREFEKLLQLLRDQYEVVLIDTPAILDFTEGSVVAPTTDGVLLILMLGKTLVVDAVHARELLDAHSARLLGVVANRAPGVRQNGYDFDYRHDGRGSRFQRQAMLMSNT